MNNYDHVDDGMRGDPRETPEEREIERLQQALRIKRDELARYRLQYENLVKIVANIMSVMPPDFVKPDGTVMQFVPPDPLAYLRRLGAAVSKAVAETKLE